MSNRMSVLSRRLGRFAGGFSFATVAFFSIGLYAAANTKGQVVFLFAGLVLACLFASFFLWLAHGFAWAMIPEKPAEAKKLAEALKPADALKPAEAMKPAEPVKPAEAKRPAEAMKAAEEKKPEEEKVIVSEDPPEAKYTITGRRIY
jgi:cytoskeletal protein RodZ